MKKPEISSTLRKFVKDSLSPTAAERSFVTAVYAAVCDVLGTDNCIQIGSYPRYTAIRPMHDLDCLYVVGDAENIAPDPSDVLQNLKAVISKQFRIQTHYDISFSLQTHSITITFSKDEQEVFAVDIVPAYRIEKNEFGLNMYLVPEILTKTHVMRGQFYEDLKAGGASMGWIRTDPRGYIQVATNTNRSNGDFRKSVKLVKGWRATCKRANDKFPLKSFHIEQVITGYFQFDASLDIFDAVFRFFSELREIIETPKIPDRADSKKYIDEYVSTLSDEDKELVMESRDYLLIQLENISSETQPESLLSGERRRRADSAEAYLFDYGIPVLTEANLKITATALERKGGFRKFILDAMGLIDVDRKIQFTLKGDCPQADVIKWKVKNDDNSPQPRGEITDRHTRNDPESTKYKGEHLVECYAVRNNVCIARGFQKVVLK